MKKKSDFSAKPYNRCLSCPHRKVRCDGPRTAGLELARWCEYMRDMKEVNGLTNAYIAETSGVSIKTIERLMAMNSDQDIMRETARRIENAIIGSTSKYPCYLAFEEENLPDEQKLDQALRELERALSDNKDYRQALDNIHTSYNAEMQVIRDQAQKQVEALLKEIHQARAEAERWHVEADRWHAESERWRSESERKGNLIDKYTEKFIS